MPLPTAHTEYGSPRLITPSRSKRTPSALAAGLSDSVTIDDLPTIQTEAPPPCRKRVSSVFAYVCPEPILVNR